MTVRLRYCIAPYKPFIFAPIKISKSMFNLITLKNVCNLVRLARLNVKKFILELQRDKRRRWITQWLPIFLRHTFNRNSQKYGVFAVLKQIRNKIDS